MKLYKINASAKINLFLDVNGKREDGYHNITSVMQEISLQDEIEIYEKKQGIEIICDNDNTIPLDSSNTCYKAAALMKEKYNINTGIGIKIKKHIPSEAGLAGGSSDAAATLKGINNLWNLGLNIKDLCEIGKQVGADVPFTIVGGTCLCEGIGDIITELSPFVWDTILVIKPNISISTPAIYKAFSSDDYNRLQDNKTVEYIRKGENRNVCLSIANALEIPAIKLHPEIQAIKNNMMKNGAISALMTGSGSCVYGFYESRRDFENSFEKFNREYPRVYKVSTVRRS